MTTVKKSKFILLVVLLAIMALLVTGALKVNDKTVSAANEEYSISKVEKAQLRLTAEGGLRFRFTVDAATRKNIIDNENVKIQFIIAPEKYFASGVAEDNGLKVFLNDESNNIYASTSEGVYYVNGCIQNVNVKNVALDFQCMARIVEVGEDGQTVAAVKASALSDARNLYDVVNKTVLLENDSSASAILDEASTPYSTWFGTDTYPVCVETQGEYEILKNKCAAEGNTSFANVAVAVADEITFGESDFPETNKPSVDKMYTVTFMNGSDVYATVKVKNGKNAVEPAINPTMNFDGAYTYKFLGWEDCSGITQDKIINAKYDKKAIIDDEITLWESEGAKKLGSALNNADVIDTMGSANVYSAKGYYGTTIANGDIKTEPYVKFYLAFKTSRQVSLANSDGKNVTESEKWYYVCYEKAGDVSWKFTVKPFGENNYLNTLKSGTIVYADQYFSAKNASFTNMFKTWFWADVEADREHIVYATDVWGVNIADVADDEIAAWKDAGATNLGSALNESGVVTTEEKFGSQTVYKFTDAQYGDIANKNIKVSEYKTLYLAFKTTQDVGLLVSDGTYAQKANTWYFVRYDKNADGSWSVTINVVANSKDTEKSIIPSTPANLASTATFNMMFKMWNWDTKYNVYATDVWGVK